MTHIFYMTHIVVQQVGFGIHTKCETINGKQKKINVRKKGHVASTREHAHHYIIAWNNRNVTHESERSNCREMNKFEGIVNGSRLYFR